MPQKKRLLKPARTLRGEVTRTKLIGAAHGLFLKNGFHGTSMRQIAEEAGVAVGGLYNHFRNKDEIFAAVLDAYHPYHVILPALEVTEGQTVEAFVHEVARQVRAAMSEAKAQFLPLIFIELVEFQGQHLKQLVDRLVPRLLDFPQRFTQRRGQLRPLPPPVLFRAFMGLLAGYFLSEMLLKDTELFRRNDIDWFDGMVDIYLHGILEPEA
jgi:AcrR family transcriptional regulator